jgi:hypothetical protein
MTNIVENDAEIEHEEKELQMLGLDWRDAMERLECTRPELHRWIAEGRLPYDGLVRTYRFSSMSRSHPTIEGGWRPETIEAAKPHVEEWREEHKIEKRQRQRNRKTIKNLSTDGATMDAFIDGGNERVEGQ